MLRTFDREYELEDGRGVLRLSQLEEGDVNCVVWDAALVLAKYIEKRAMKESEWLKNKRVLELGAGLGCVGLVTSCYGANVNLTDQPKALPLVEHNIQINRDLLHKLNCSISALSLDWNELVAPQSCDVLLMADCVYYEESIQPLVNIMNQIASKETEILLSQEDRSYSDKQKSTWTAFKIEIEKYFTVSEIPAGQQHSQYTSSDIWLLQLKKKCTE